jgi:hypothetical protein
VSGGSIYDIWAVPLWPVDMCRWWASLLSASGGVAGRAACGQWAVTQWARVRTSVRDLRVTSGSRSPLVLPFLLLSSYFLVFTSFLLKINYYIFFF